MEGARGCGDKVGGDDWKKGRGGEEEVGGERRQHATIRCVYAVAYLVTLHATLCIA